MVCVIHERCSIQNVSATNLDLRLSNNDNKDELSELADTFNDMLDRLENSFDAQKHFVFGIGFLNLLSGI